MVTNWYRLKPEVVSFLQKFPAISLNRTVQKLGYGPKIKFQFESKKMTIILQNILSVYDALQEKTAF